MNNIILKRIYSDDFRHIYNDMEKQFPVSEMKPYAIFVKLIEENKLECYGAFDNNTEIGYVLYAPVNNTKWLEYIAVKKEYHCKGYGKKILSLLNNCYLEVEKPDEGNPDTIRRVRFYTSLGAEKLDINYIYPNNQGGLPMDLYFIGSNLPDKASINKTIKYVFNSLHSDIKDVNVILQNIL